MIIHQYSAVQTRDHHLRELHCEERHIETTHTIDKSTGLSALSHWSVDVFEFISVPLDPKVLLHIRLDIDGPNSATQYTATVQNSPNLQ